MPEVSNEGADSMPEVSEQPALPETILVDLPLRPLLPIAGVLIAAIGALVRCFARWLAWPTEFGYTGDRASTVWAYRESLYADLGLVALAFGLAMVLLAIARSTWLGRRAEPIAAPDRRS